jgi:hypothetical protein
MLQQGAAQRHGNAEKDQADRDLQGKTDDEDIDLRHRPGHNPQAHIGKENDRDHGNTQFQSQDEHVPAQAHDEIHEIPGDMERKQRMRRLHKTLIEQGLYVRPVYLNELMSEYGYFIVSVDDPYLLYETQGQDQG